VVRPLAAELAQDPVHLCDAALRLPEDDALAVGVHGAAEHAAAVLAEPERPLLLSIDLCGRVGESDEEIWGSGARDRGERRCGRGRQGRCG
jgi:hypothetical protein